VADPEAAAACHRAGVGREVTVALGHRLDPRWGKPVTVTGTVTRLSDGRFRYIGGIWDGVEGNMGPSAVLTVGAIQVLIATHGTYDWVDEQFRSMEMQPPDAKFIVVKNPMNYRLAYGEIAKAAFILDTPGATPVTCRHLPYKYLKRPYFPLDTEIPGLTPTILQ
jgi:microcystin degradation protein MlrC